MTPYIPDGLERAYLAYLRDKPRDLPRLAPGALCGVAWCVAYADDESYGTHVARYKTPRHGEPGTTDLRVRRERNRVACAIHRKHEHYRAAPFRGRNPWRLKANTPPALWQRQRGAA